MDTKYILLAFNSLLNCTMMAGPGSNRPLKVEKEEKNPRLIFQIPRADLQCNLAYMIRLNM